MLGAPVRKINAPATDGERKNAVIGCTYRLAASCTSNICCARNKHISKLCQIAPQLVGYQPKDTVLSLGITWCVRDAWCGRWGSVNAIQRKIHAKVIKRECG